jgi:probable O-glycosylation ligase (exosortase A-associated)
VSVFSALPLTLVFPFIGVLLWGWITFMHPQRESFGLAADYEFNYYIAIVTLFAWAFSLEPKTLPNQVLTALIILFAALFSITTYFAIDHVSAYELWDRHIKTIALVLVAMAMTTSKLRIQALLWVIALSVGYYAAKGGAYFLFTGGGADSPVFGPDETMIDDNNHLALAILITIPILFYLRTTSANMLVKWVLLGAIVLSVMAIVGTYSRGGFVGLVVVGLAFMMTARRKLAAVLMAGTLALGIVSVAPPDWVARIAGIQEFEKDESSISRLAAWQASWNLAQDRPLLGGGFSAIEVPNTYVKYRTAVDSTETDGRAAHSIYFQLLGDHGFPTFFVYLAMIAAGMYNLVRVQVMTRGVQSLAWANLLSRMMSVSFAGFLTAGAFLSMAYYDAFLCILGMTACLRQVVTQSLGSAIKDPTEDIGVDLPPAGRPVPSFRR